MFVLKRYVVTSFFVLLFLVMCSHFVPTVLATQPDATGNSIGTISEITGSVEKQVSITDVALTTAHNKAAINMVWLLITGFLVMFMQAGFALVETGFVRVKNVVHTMAMNIMIYAIGVLGFWAVGFGLMFGGVGALTTLGGGSLLNHEFTITLLGKSLGLFGLKGFFLNNGVYDVSVFAMFLFQMVFMDTAATIPTGAMAERWKFLAFVIYGFFISTIIYPVFGNWVWGGGWLSQLGTTFGMGHGMVDFAGSAVVHMTGGFTALAGVLVLGPRLGKYTKDGKVNIISAHNIPMIILGTLILAFGWFGFNPGSTLAGTDLRISVIAVNTMLASAAGAFAATIIFWIKNNKPDIIMMANGLLAGLVAITGPSAFVNAQGAVIIGLVAGVLVYSASIIIERTLKIDDPVGAIAVHGVNGVWGIIAVGLFADGSYGAGLNGVSNGVRGLFYGDPSQLVAQTVGIAVNIVFVFGLSYTMFKVLDKIIGIRVSKDVELAGLDLTEMGYSGYPEEFPVNVIPVKNRRSSGAGKQTKNSAILPGFGNPAPAYAENE